LKINESLIERIIGRGIFFFDFYFRLPYHPYGVVFRRPQKVQNAGSVYLQLCLLRLGRTAVYNHNGYFDYKRLRFRLSN
jgi:hypothetical protein